MIPPNITREHIIQALDEIRNNEIPWHRESVRWCILYNGKEFPPKYVIGVANRFANGVELGPHEFSGGDETNSFLTERGFEIVTRGSSDPVSHSLLPEREEVDRAIMLIGRQTIDKMELFSKIEELLGERRQALRSDWREVTWSRICKEWAEKTIE